MEKMKHLNQLDMRQQLSFTFEELRSMDIQDVDAYVAAGVSPDLDCHVLGYPPAGPVCANPFGVQVLCIDALRTINELLAQKKEEEVHQFILEGQQRIAEYTKERSIDERTC